MGVGKSSEWEWEGEEGAADQRTSYPKDSLFSGGAVCPLTCRWARVQAPEEGETLNPGSVNGGSFWLISGTSKPANHLRSRRWEFVGGGSESGLVFGK